MPFRVRPGESGDSVWIHDFGMVTADGREIEISEVKNVFHEAYAQIVAGEMEDDGFNRLVLRARLDWREVTVLRAYAKYLRQAGIAFSQAYMEETLARNARHRAPPGAAVPRAVRSRQQATAAERAADQRAGDREGARRGHQSRRGPHPAPLPQPRPVDPAHQFLPARQGTYISFKLDSQRSRSCRCRARWSRSSSIARGSRRSICAAARWRAAASAGPTGARISAPRSWA